MRDACRVGATVVLLAASAAALWGALRLLLWLDAQRWMHTPLPGWVGTVAVWMVICVFAIAALAAALHAVRGCWCLSGKVCEWRDDRRR